MDAGGDKASTNPFAANGVKRKPAPSAEPEANDPSASPNQVAHTLTACTRCRSRKTRCDPGLPRCTPCERTNSVCEYYDSNRGRNIRRSYVVYLQHKVRELEEELEKLENEDGAEDPETLMRAASVRVHDAKDSKYLGPSSGIAITRLVMQLAKQFTDAKSIKDIVPEQRARHIKELYNQEQAKPTSKVYPLISDVAAVELPPKHPITDLLVQLYKLKVQPMYPVLHEPTLDKDIDTVYYHADSASDYQHFLCRMVIAISLQKMDTQYAGLADSYYLAALQYLPAVVKPMDLQTLQCFALMAQYSLLTPTRTAIYYVVGIAVRLAQALGLNEEKTIARGRADGTADYLEVDMRRRLFWCIMVLEYGLAHSLGRPAMLATSADHIDVKWFETCEDQYITPTGIDPAAPRPSLKKWVSIHFFKMRLLQLEIRRKLYQRKRPEPQDDADPWFIGMEARLAAWRDASPSQEEGLGVDTKWFTARYNTMVVFLYRPCPQVPRPSLQAALKCFDACQYNIHISHEQILKHTVDLTWIFTQAIFMAINTMLWSLSYVEVRRLHKREEVERHLEVAMDSIERASERWPGVASAVQLYQNLIAAVLKIYDKDGDIPISATTPSEAPSPGSNFPDTYNRSQTTSPATVSSNSVSTPPERAPPFGYLHQNTRRSVEQPPPVPYQSDPNTFPTTSPPARNKSSTLQQQSSSDSVHTLQSFQMQHHHQQQQSNISYDPSHQFNALPEFIPDLTIPSWSAPGHMQMPFASAPAPMQSLNGFSNHAFDPTNPPYPYPTDMDNSNNNNYGGLDGSAAGGLAPHEQYAPQFWDMDSGSFGNGLTKMQQEELMHSLQTDGMEDIQTMISTTLASFTPKAGQAPTF